MPRRSAGRYYKNVEEFIADMTPQDKHYQGTPCIYWNKPRRTLDTEKWVRPRIGYEVIYSGSPLIEGWPPISTFNPVPHRIVWDYYNPDSTCEDWTLVHKCQDVLCCNPNHLFKAFRKDPELGGFKIKGGIPSTSRKPRTSDKTPSHSSETTAEADRTGQTDGSPAHTQPHLVTSECA